MGHFQRWDPECEQSRIMNMNSLFSWLQSVLFYWDYFCYCGLFLLRKVFYLLIVGTYCEARTIWFYVYLFLFQYSMNPFYKMNMPIKCPSFDRKVMVYGRKHLVSWFRWISRSVHDRRGRCLNYFHYFPEIKIFRCWWEYFSSL